ncbi:hypothetical protein [Desulfosediminicola flagellatus]|uniref:hypothetical protein n=1 Tax=Desulfosediminicola flagellatus TaxID=2569541 RepID=UPI0010AD81E8|nr:hypothetical protein [Desulfosediminicola flagellatus]
MKKQTAVAKKKEALRFRKAGKCFVIGKAAGDFLPGRKLLESYEDQFNRRYIKIDGQLEMVKDEHGFLAA